MRISHKTQLYAVQLLTSWTVREIEVLFTGNDLTARADQLDEQRWPVGGSVRRDTAARYHAALDPGTPNAEARLLRVYDEMLEEARDSSKPSGQQLRSDGAKLAHLLRRDGCEIDPDGRIASHHFELKTDASSIDVSFEGYGRVRDPEVLREHARRIQGALGRADPADAVLAAREMVESTCKLILDDYNERPPKNANLGQLYKQAAGVLELDAAAIEGDTDASRAAKQVLQGLVSVTAGMGELRTRIGRGHGQARQSPARQRHAELTTSCAAAVTLFLLDTWHERKAKSGPQLLHQQLDVCKGLQGGGH
jgi:hypothetical protein